MSATMMVVGLCGLLFGAQGQRGPAVLVVVESRARDDVRSRPELAAQAVERVRGELARAGFEAPDSWIPGRVPADRLEAETALREHLSRTQNFAGASEGWLACELNGADVLVEIGVQVLSERTQQGRRRVRAQLRLRLREPDGRLLFSKNFDTQASSLSENFGELHRQSLRRLLEPESGVALSELQERLDARRRRDDAEGPVYLVWLSLHTELEAPDVSGLEALEGVSGGSVELVQSDGSRRLYALRHRGGRAKLEAELVRWATPPNDISVRVRCSGRGRHLQLSSTLDTSQTVDDGWRTRLRSRARALAEEVYRRDVQWFDDTGVRFAPRPWLVEIGPEPSSEAEVRPLALSATLEALSKVSQDSFLRASQGRVNAVDSRGDSVMDLLRERKAWALDQGQRFPEELRSAWRVDGARRVVLTGLDSTPPGWRLSLSVVDLESGWKESAVESLDPALAAELDAAFAAD